MGATRTPRGGWIEEGLRALAAGGPQAVRIEALAQVLGVSKGGFYGHFGNRDALIAEMLDTWERESAGAVIEQVEAAGGEPRAKLKRLFSIVAASEEPARAVAVELAVRDWARREPSVAQRMRRVDNLRMNYLRSLFGAFCPDGDDVEVRSTMFYSLRIAGHFMAADHGTRSRAEVMELTRDWLLR
ncbi:TetR/AcrR family transcriptional regulator [Streptomyces sp. H27-H1]|uniref:TetR/AcrR family transcriptional regulator n=1 Tax=Streptomyces sp. H27-H1 TaxID=2996461 RepID=UPI00226E52A3|nr:TetR/AcrR family transcriptional regulator [Streptomyces sp. H27-H1]MCY0928524.1 TetR/AcrR family transcriptional regulator [Streptomyces sp. H27-H1]